jgi:hypothetical protein
MTNPAELDPRERNRFMIDKIRADDRRPTTDDRRPTTDDRRPTNARSKAIRLRGTGLCRPDPRPPTPPSAAPAGPRS